MNRNMLLIVDDMEVNRAILRALFEDRYNLLEAENGEQALMLLKQYQDSIAAMLLDLVMPVKNGYQVMVEMEAVGLLGKVPVVVITAEDSSDSEVRAFDLGASDIIMKPFEPHVVKRRVQNTVELNRHKAHLEEMVEEQAVKLRESQEVLMDALSSVIEHRSIESGQHVLRIRMFTKVLLEDVMRSYPEYDLDERNIGLIASAAALHDIGKIAIPDAILKKPGPLTKEEFEIMKTHSEKGCEILASLGRMHDKEYLRYGYNICRYHHERWDGGGYPCGLKGDSIPICAQVVGVADAYDALTTDRVYKKAYSSEKAFNMILNGECGAFSPRLLECFKNVREQFKELAHYYADGHSPKADNVQLTFPAAHRPGMDAQNTLELGQMKYFTMLRYAGATVVELDVGSGVYHMVYQQNSDFDTLHHGNLFADAYENFAVQSVHPEDREIVRSFFNGYIQNFFDNGLMKYTRRYRVLHRSTGEYTWYEGTVLRIDINDPELKKVLLVWKECPEGTSQTVMPAEAPMVQGPMVGSLRCRNDRPFTILQANDGFINLFGYTREELKDRFQNSYLNMIHPDDRQGMVAHYREQVAGGGLIELEYRVVTKGGQVLWVLEKCHLGTGEDGAEYILGVLVDITQSKEEKEQLRLAMERHQVIMDQSNDIIFEWDMKGDSISFSSNWVKKFGYLPIREEVAERIPTASHLLPEDVPKFNGIMRAVSSGETYAETELRVADAQGQYIWCRIRATTQFDNAGKPIKAVGVILDIDEEKRQVQKLMDKAERDTLTQLYNKNAARQRMEHILEQRAPGELSALMIVDLDNFKMVNDSRGHMFGDAVLVEIAAQLEKRFRNQDIVARIGGDEFMIFLNGVSGLEAVCRRAESVTEIFRDNCADALRDCQLSCSVGVACCPEDGEHFQDLFQRCDLALYRAKAQGKNQYMLYDKATMSKTFGLNQEQLMVASTRIDSDEVSDFDTNGIVQRAFQELYEAGDVEQAVNSILELVGREFNVSRAYIFEDSEDGEYCCNTFEWCNEGIQSERDKLQQLYYRDLGDNYRGNFDENGIFYCPDVTTLPKEQYDVLAPQMVKSLLQCAIRNNGKFAGYVGFDECTGRRMWTQEQIDALTFISELLSTFLLKKRAQDRALATAQDLRMLLDHQNSWIYVIDPDTYELCYINKKTYGIAPEAKLGMRCYQAFFDRESPCEMCPARDIRARVNQTLEVYNPVLKVWSLADASFIRWNGREACLLCCHDVTRYKKT